MGQKQEIYKLKQNSTETLTRLDLLDKNYPSPRADFYLGYKLENDVREGFGNITWDISKLAEKYPFGHVHLFSMMRDDYFCPGSSVCS
mgnify:CR=1 FL=1